MMFHHVVSFAGHIHRITSTLEENSGKQVVVPKQSAGSLAGYGLGSFVAMVSAGSRIAAPASPHGTDLRAAEDRRQGLSFPSLCLGNRGGLRLLVIAQPE
ncbi:hypothetical protein [Rhizobium lentis]|uniref:Uncharacterized protein n=1 Tax=Rhizobium lentis TaxID=1138194 RepID=A0A7W8UNE8_9HYPH|nr:hypothetical protein [Rhizobium lentis]MBB4574893.1 hypothetical protein [Rhizobium lentis]MBB5550820.1 hypothetical protein [Rhizobium lentis]MBB5561058.1 hypothetical protein [Rhizobium lentis]MBB5567939.1 hypothetical protein [Rhizobium lentis]